MTKFFVVSIFLVNYLISTPSHYQPKIVNYDTIVSLIKAKSQKVKVFNFWATWCGPCVTKFPFFTFLSQDKEMQNHEFYYISVNSVKEIKYVTDFLEKHDVQKNAYLINNVHFNDWIDKIDLRWSGSIPMVLVVFPDGYKKISEKEFKSLVELKQFVKQKK